MHRGSRRAGRQAGVQVSGWAGKQAGRRVGGKVGRQVGGWAGVQAGEAGEAGECYGVREGSSQAHDTRGKGVRRFKRCMKTSSNLG